MTRRVLKVSLELDILFSMNYHTIILLHHVSLILCTAYFWVLPGSTLSQVTLRQLSVILTSDETIMLVFVYVWAHTLLSAVPGLSIPTSKLVIVSSSLYLWSISSYLFVVS